MIQFTPNPQCDYRLDYPKLISDINQAIQEDRFSDAHDQVRQWSLEDLFFYMHFILRVDIINHPWLIQRVYEVQDDNSNTMDLWAREHGKSSIITYGLNLWHLTRDPEQRIGIFSHTRAIAKAFLRRIKHTLESNKNLPTFFPDVFYNDPKNEALKHSEDDGLIVKRQGIYQEPSVAAYGLVDGMPTGMHFTVLNFDDVVTKESVSTPDQVFKVEEAFGLAQNLGEITGIKRVTGTNYHFNDLYQTQEKTGIWKVRRYPATDNGSITGNPVFFSRELLEEKRAVMGSYVFSCQLLLNPVADENQVFQRQWLRYYRQLPERSMNLYLFCDPASGRKEKQARSDYTVFWLWGLDPMKNIYLVDLVRDRLNLVGRWEALKKMMQKHPKIIKVYYEQYALQADIEHFQSRMGDEGIYFQIEELGGKLGKVDRIQKLVPMFEGGRVYLPEVMFSPDGKRDLVREFVEEEYLLHPFAPHDDMLDAASRLLDEKAECYYPTAYPDDEDGPRRKVIQLNNWSRRKADSRFAYA